MVILPYEDAAGRQVTVGGLKNEKKCALARSTFKLARKFRLSWTKWWHLVGPGSITSFDLGRAYSTAVVAILALRKASGHHGERCERWQENAEK